MYFGSCFELWSKKGINVKILVTGGAGFIGSHLAEKLYMDGHEVTVLDSLSDFLYPKSIKERHLQELINMGIRFEYADLASTSLIEILENQEVVINQAAIPGLVKSWSHFSEYAHSNVIGVGKLLEASVITGVQKFVQISTSSVYGINATGPEDSQKNPVSPYGVTKLSAELLAEAYKSNHNIDLTILRYFSVYGPRQRPDMAYFKFIDAIIEGKPISIYGDGLQNRTNTFVSDVVDATAACLKIAECPEEKIFNIAGGKSHNLLEVVKKLELILGKEARLQFMPAKKGDQRSTVGVIEKAEKYLNWKPTIELDLGLEKQVQWQMSLRSNF
jgi:UDP-glucose 4-epimerase